MLRDPQSFSHLCGLLLGAKAPRIVWWYATLHYYMYKLFSLPLKSPAPTALGLFHLTRNKLRSTILDWWYATSMIGYEFSVPEDWYSNELKKWRRDLKLIGS